jgi:hypothetical protein
MLNASTGRLLRYPSTGFKDVSSPRLRILIAALVSVEGEGRNPNRAHVLKLGARHSLDAKAVASIVDQVRAAIARWADFAGAAEVTKASAREIQSAHERLWSALDV